MSAATATLKDSLTTSAEPTATVEAPAAPAMSKLVLGLLTGIALIVAFSESMLIPALPIIQAQYGASATDVAWVPAIYLLVGAASVPLVGKLGDIYGRKRMLLVVMMIYSLAAIGNGFSWSLESLLFFRGLQGVGLAMFPLAFALIHDQVPAAKVPLATGLVSGMNSVGSTIGLLGGAAITAAWGWQWNYRILGPVAIVLTLLLAVFALEGSRREKEGIDYAGAAFFAIGVGLLLVAVTEGASLGWTSAVTLSLFGVAGVLLVIFVVQELRVKQPMMNFRLPGIRSMLKTDFLMFVAGACFYLGFEAIIYFSQQVGPGFGLDITGAALVLLPGAVLMIVFALLAGVLMRRYGIRVPELIGLVLLMSGFLSLFAFHGSEVQVAADFIPIVAGVAMLFNCVVNATMVLSPPAKVGAQNGTLTVFQEVGQSIAAAIAGVALATFVNPSTGVPTGTAYIVICSVGIGLAVMGLLVLATLPTVVIPGSPAASKLRDAATDPPPARSTSEGPEAPKTQDGRTSPPS
jgi:MFS family permease